MHLIQFNQTFKIFCWFIRCVEKQAVMDNMPELQWRRRSAAVRNAVSPSSGNTPEKRKVTGVLLPNSDGLE